MIYDSIVIGGGPAGSMCAYLLQKRGVQCLILEKNINPYEKVCGGLLTWNTLNLLENSKIPAHRLLDEGGQKILGYCYSKKGVKNIIRYHHGEYGIGVSRKIFDSYLLNWAGVSGAVIKRGERVKKIYTNEDKFIINGYWGNNVIIATGARGFISPDYKSIYKLQPFGISAIIKGNTSLDNNMVYFWYYDDSPDYFWAIPVSDKCWNVGIWFQHMPMDPLAQYKKKEISYIYTNFSDIIYVMKPRGGFCGTQDLTSTLHSSNRIEGVGDFVGTCRYETGEGIFYALESSATLASDLLNATKT